MEHVAEDFPQSSFSAELKNFMKTGPSWSSVKELHSGSYGEFFRSNLFRRCPICHGEARIFDRAYGVRICFSIYGYMGYRVHIRRVEYDSDGSHTEELFDEPTMSFALMSCKGKRTQDR